MDTNVLFQALRNCKGASLLEASSYFSNRFKGKEKKEIFEDFDSVMEKIGEAESPEWDAM